MNPIVYEIANKIQMMIDVSDSNQEVKKLMNVNNIMRDYDLTKEEAQEVVELIDYRA